MSRLRRYTDEVHAAVAGAVARPVAATVGTVVDVAGGLRSGATASPLRHPADELAWHRTAVLGRRTYYGVGGTGPPVLFLHGWAMGNRAYKRAVRRLISRGCRVYVPALPGFAGTTDLPRRQTSIAGYAEWVDAFMSVVGIDEPAMVIGHSFGGGVAIKLAHQEPQRVRYLVLVNSVGGVHPASRLGRRPPWDWAAGFAREFLPLPQGLELVDAMREDVVANVLRSPLALARVAELARRADLRAELADLRDWELPVLALTSDDDGVIPLAAFEALCDAIGTEGKVLPGGHSWLLADPDAFGEVLANVVETQVVEHRAATASGRAERIGALLASTSVPSDAAQRLLVGASPIWLMSEDPEVLAGDLAMCHPPPAPGEVRAMARPLEGGGARLTVVAGDRPGLLADSAAVLAGHGLAVSGASAATWPGTGLALHAFRVEPDGPVDDHRWERLGADLRRMTRTGLVPPPEVVPAGTATVTVNGSPDERTIVRVAAPDRPGLLWSACRWFADRGVSIESLHAETDHGIARDTFIVLGAFDADALAAELGEPAARLSGSAPA